MCGYCLMGCFIEVGFDEKGKVVVIWGVVFVDVNCGKFCIKGIFEYEFFEVFGCGNRFIMCNKFWDVWQLMDWDMVLDKMVGEIKCIQSQYGCDVFVVVFIGQIMIEEFYILGKLVCGCIGINNYDGNIILCMVLAVFGYKWLFGLDGLLGCYDDFEYMDCLIVWGLNLFEQYLIIYWCLKEVLEKCKFLLIVVDL